jgi:hypothetical protein
LIVVFDSGVWISAFHFGGTPLAAIGAAIGNCSIAVCDSIRAEIRTVLRLKFRWSEERIEQSLAEYEDLMFTVDVRGRLRGMSRPKRRHGA